ncbi:hypothetical protein KQX54_004592 [Cotesia glomerata]|uniref:Uncharacterized protein n=1 Tax=Cotesia glomerata TaxID=32391 RepID=A0AAV7I2J6_COTGL|nr:hypothetical protein KQX54_004592 [Cotesia glomerata]
MVWEDQRPVRNYKEVQKAQKTLRASGSASFFSHEAGLIPSPVSLGENQFAHQKTGNNLALGLLVFQRKRSLDNPLVLDDRFGNPTPGYLQPKLKKHRSPADERSAS